MPMPAVETITEAPLRWRDAPTRHPGRRPTEDSPPVPLLTRRPPRHASEHQLVACLDVAARSDHPLSEADAHIVQAVALRRVQRAIRSADRVCLSDGMRIAVCFGPLAEGTDPAALAERVADAVGHRLMLAEHAVDLDVAVGLALGSPGAASSPLIDAAQRSIRPRRPRPTGGAAAPTLHPDLTVGRPSGDAVAASTMAAPRTFGLVPRGGATSNGARDDGVRRAHPLGAEPPLTVAAATGPVVAPVLVVDALPTVPGLPGVTAQAVATCVSDAGVPASAVAPRRVGDAAGPDHAGRDGSGPGVVLLVVHPTAAGRLDPEASRQWEQPAVLCRNYRRAGAGVVVVSAGATAAAVAGCVEHGATEVIDIEELPHHAAALAQHLGDGGASRSTWPSSRFDPARYEPLMQLTPSERKVLYHLTTGSSASEIAGLLVVSIATVRSHIRSILRKLDVGSQLAAVAIARGEHAGVPAR
jgi:DNA-binding CsgD family transcriptional regulator